LLLWGNVLDSWSLGNSSGLVLLNLIGLLGLHLLEVSFLKLLLGGLEVGISGGGVLGSLSLDLIEGHTDNGLLNSGGSLGSLLLDVLDLGLLQESTGSLGPEELYWLDSLVEKGSGLGAHKVMNLTVSCGESRSSTWVDFHLCV
jgi:hypothetical protein